MSFKMMIDIKDELFDLWEVRTIQRFKEYDENLSDFKYFIQLNREGKGTNAENILIACESESDMEDTLKSIKIRLKDLDTVEIF